MEVRLVAKDKRQERVRGGNEKVCRLLLPNCKKSGIKPPAECWTTSTLSLHRAWGNSWLNHYYKKHKETCENTTHCSTIRKNAQHVYFECRFTGRLMCRAKNVCLAQPQGRHVNEKRIKPNPSRVRSCLINWELWVESDHIQQKYYRLTTVYKLFCNDKLEGFNFYADVLLNQPWRFDV